MIFTDLSTSYHGLEAAVTKRLSDNWQASLTYTLAGFWDRDPLPLNPGCDYPLVAPGVCNVAFDVPIDIGGERSLAAGDQRHRLVFNGIWRLPYRFQVSGLYFFASGQRFRTTYGADLRDNGNTDGRLRPDGTIAPRNALVGRPLHRTDVRLSRQFPLGGTVRVDLMAEVFNLFNHANYGSYVTVESNRAYGQPVQNTAIEYQPRTMQFGFRLAF
jgi:hypothetical protein